jgi:deazaflavin-dependent oxidoreductase (nitroreductase family)
MVNFAPREGLVPTVPNFLDRVRQFNKRTFNPWILRSAGDVRSPFAVVSHVGRRTGAEYRTPVVALPVQDGFVFALTYGPGVDWYRNVLAAGSCTLRWRGQTYRLEAPETLPAEVALRSFPFPFRPILRLMRKRDFFRMRAGNARNG